MKKVLHVSTFYPPHLGGIEDVCYNIVRYLSTVSSVEQRVICFNDGRSTRTDRYDGVDVVRVGHLGKISSQCIAPGYYHNLRREFRKFRPGFVHFHAPNPLAAAALLATIPKEVKLIVHWHSDIIAQKRIYKIIKPVETALLKRADTIVGTSQLYVEHSEPLRPFLSKCVVIPNIINTAKMECDEAAVDEIRQRYGNKPILFFIGRHVPYKGLHHLLAAVPMLKHDCEVVIGGHGTLTKQLQEDYPLKNVHFTGRITDEQLAAYCHAADIFLFPSVTKNEAFGVALAEAMWCHTPAVTFTIPGSGVNWVNIDGQTGVEVENGNVPKLAEAIDYLLENEELRHEYGRNARQRVADHMVLDKITGLLDSLYK